MIRIRFLLLLVSLMFIGRAATAYAEPDAPAIQRAIEQLGSGRQAAREQAARELWEAGLAAEAALRRAAESNDAEVRYRARSVLEKFKFGLFADTPPEIAASIRQFHNGDNNTRLEVLQQLQAKGHLRSIQALLKTDDDVNLQRRYIATSGLEINGLVPFLLRQGEFAPVEEWLEDISDFEVGAGTFAAYWLMRGKADERIKSLRDELANGVDTRRAKQLAYLLRAKGDWPAARVAAEQAGDAALLKTVFVEQRDWSEVARLHEQRRPIAPPRQASVADTLLLQFLGNAAAYQRLAGRPDAAAKWLDEITELATKHPDNLWPAAKALLINDRRDEGITLLREASPAVAFRLLAFQHRHREAFDLIGLKSGRKPDRDWYLSLPAEMSARSSKKTNRYEFALEVARQLHVLGKHAESQSLFALLAQIAQDGEGTNGEAQNNADKWLPLATAEFKIGLVPAACEHAARAIKIAEPRPVLDQFFGTRVSEAEVWWQFFRRQQPEASAATTLLRIYHVLLWVNSRADVPPLPERDDAEFRKLVAAGLLAATELEEKDQLAWRLGMGETCLARQQVALARDCFQAAESSSEAAVRLADTFYLEQNWTAAAQQYRRAWENGFDQLVALFLAGRSLEKAGQAESGRELVQQANLLAVNSRARLVLAKALQDRDLADDAIEQWTLVLQTQPATIFESTEPPRRLALLLQTRDNLRTAECWDRVLFSILQGIHFNEEESYLRVTSMVHRNRARGLVEAGQFEAALREAELARQAAPADVSLGEEVVPALDKAGRKQQADELFDKQFATLDQLRKEWPDCGWHYNDLAWLAARCHRRLDEAFAHAQRAVELAPHNASYVDTLAETHFHLGRRDAAIECSQRCLALNPGTKIFREQLARFQNDPLP